MSAIEHKDKAVSDDMIRSLSKLSALYLGNAQCISIRVIGHFKQFRYNVQNLAIDILKIAERHKSESLKKLTT